jgi:hypothetical protein
MQAAKMCFQRAFDPPEGISGLYISSAAFTSPGLGFVLKVLWFESLFLKLPGMRRLFSGMNRMGCVANFSGQSNHHELCSALGVENSRFSMHLAGDAASLFWLSLPTELLRANVNWHGRSGVDHGRS